MRSDRKYGDDYMRLSSIGVGVSIGVDVAATKWF